MADAAICKVEDALAAALAAWPALAGRRIITDQSLDIAVDTDEGDAVLVYTTTYDIEVDSEHGQSLHTALTEFEAVSGTQTVGTISRANHNTIAAIIACLASDRTLGGMLQDIQEVDVAPAAPNGKDVGSASLQVRIEFYTPRDDWTVILGQGGATF